MSTLQLLMFHHHPFVWAADTRSPSQGFLHQQLKTTIIKPERRYLCEATKRKSSKWQPYEKAEEVRSINGYVEDNVLKLLRPVEHCWQPHQFLPDPNSDRFYDQVKELREETQELPDDYLVVLVGDLITEEALPTYECFVNNAEGFRDITMCDSSPLSRWTRGWTAEENRHGDLLNKFLYLSGRVDMNQIEKTIHYLIRAGSETKAENDGFGGIMYGSFQERATFVSHANTAKMAQRYGSSMLSQICGIIAGDEKRHETAYTNMMAKLFEIDPSYSMLIFADMMQMKISMPGQFMYDGIDENLFNHYALVAQRVGVYTPSDYADILEHFIGRWKVETMVGLSSEAQEAQEFLCNLVAKIRVLEERIQAKAKDKSILQPFSWIFCRKVNLY